ncbi:MAG TPA: MarR family transcriptional regulator [Polyangiaceae bacterium]|nr:MarR family transcriptional regulator [Polyangiaceae bacterium]
MNHLGRQFSDATILLHTAIARKAGLSGTDHKYLGMLIQQGAMTAGDFAKITGLTSGAITGLVDRLEKKKLVRRLPDKHDRRRVSIVPDAARAQKLLGTLFSDLQRRMSENLVRFDAREIAIIEKYMISTIEIMREATQAIKGSAK